MGKGEYSALQKIQVTCKTCEVSESFYSNLSVERFRSDHRGHDVVGGGGQGRPSRAREVNPAPREEEPLEVEPGMMPAEDEPLETEAGKGPAEEVPLDGEAGTKVTEEGPSEVEGMSLAKVVVDLQVFPALPNPVFRVRGFRDNLEAFVCTSPFEQRKKVGEMLASGQYFDQDFSGLRYVWEPGAIEYEEDAREMLGSLDYEAHTERIAEERSGARESPQGVDQPTVASTDETLFATPGEGEIGDAAEEVLSVTSPAGPAPNDTPEALAPPSPPQPTQEQPPVHEMTEPPAPRPVATAKPDEKKAEWITTEEAAARSGEEPEEDQILVSKSWYIQGGTGNRSEAVRISKVLKAFRWKVEPVYTIGVILDDILSIETTRNQISRTLIKRIEEDAGYRLTAVTMDQGKPVAWFKKEASEVPPIPDPAAVPGAEEPTSRLSRVSKMAGANEPVAPALDDLEAELEPDVTG